MDTEDRSPSDEAARGGAEKCAVLIVDDDANFRMIVHLSLKCLGYDALTAGTWQEAVGIASHRTDIRMLITDIAMPGLNGMELAAKIREILPRVEVLYVSGIKPKATAGSDAAPVHFLQKPFQATDLDARIKAILGRP